MKQYLAVCIFALIQLPVSSQTFSPPSFVEPYPLEITFNKTTNLVFPYAIKSVDRGSANILVQKAGYVDTILQVKAARQDFPETNLSVITTDGRLYSFLVHYSPTPPHLNYYFSPGTSKIIGVFTGNGISSLKENEADFLKNAQLIIGKKKFIHRVKADEGGIQLELDGVYVKNANIYFQLQLTNNSSLPYPIELLRFLIKDKKQGKRTSLQEIEVKPVYKYLNPNSIVAKSKSRCVFVFPAFTLANSKYLLISLSERNGGRTLEVKVKDKHILQAKDLHTPSLQ